MTTTPEYDAILARKMKEREAKGNISSVKMSEAETAKEIADTTEGVFGNGSVVLDEASAVKVLAPQPKKKRGRPLGSRNRPKDTK